MLIKPNGCCAISGRRRLDQPAPGVAASILEGLDEMLTVNRLGLPAKAQALARLHQLN